MLVDTLHAANERQTLMSKHTPGPWVVFQMDGKFIVMPAGRPGDIADIEDRVESEANACLIAAAPDLLAVLQDAVVRSDKRCDEEGATRTEHGQKLYERALAAIAKATQTGTVA